MNFDRYAAVILAEYQSFANALIAEYVLRQAAGSAEYSQFRMNGLALVLNFHKRAIIATDDYLSQNDGGAASAQKRVFLDALRAIAIKNLNDMILKLMAGNVRLASILLTETGAIGKLLQKRAMQPELVALDSAGRKWQAAKLVETLARDFAYQADIDITLEKAADANFEFLEVVYPDPSHENHGLVLRTDEVAKIRKKIFHPNSTAILRPYVST